MTLFNNNKDEIELTTNFSKFIDAQFITINRDLNTLDDELRKFKNIDDKLFDELIGGDGLREGQGDYKELVRLLKLISYTNGKLSSNLIELHKNCVKEVDEGLEDKDAAKKILKRLRKNEKFTLIRIHKLALTIGDTGSAGGFSNLRHLLNLPVELLESAFSKALGRSTYDPTLMLEHNIEKAEGYLKNSHLESEDEKIVTRKEFEKVIKRFKLFIKIVEQVSRRFENEHKKALKILRKATK